MIVDSVLLNAKAYLKGEIVDCNFAIQDGKIVKIGKETHMPRADEKNDLHHMLVLPGVIDTHVHLRDEEKAYKETFTTGTASAATGGATTVLDMPNNSPVTMSEGTLNNRMELALRRVLVNVGFFSEFPLGQSEVEQIVQAGAVGFKLFMAEQVGGVDVDSDLALQDALAQAGKLDTVVAVHAEDHEFIKFTTEDLKLRNKHDLSAFLKAHDEKAEAAAVDRVLSAAKKAGKTHVHFCHVSTKNALDMIVEAKKQGLAVTAEATPHHLLLKKADYERLGVQSLTLPPLRTQENLDALWKGVADGNVDSVGSDHAPHKLEEKDAASIWDVKVGVPGLETTLPLLLTSVHQGRLTLQRLLELLCEKPAEIFGLADRGHLEEGRQADLAVVDFNRKFKIDASKFKSKAKFSPFDKWDAQGKPVKTYVGGQLVYDDGEIVAKPGSGSVIRGRAA